MPLGQSSHQKTVDGVFVAPLETQFGRILSPFEEFLHRQTAGGLVLMAMAVIAMVLANGPLADQYLAFFKTYGGVVIGDWSLKMSLGHWINDALMAVFFFVVGLELKREFLVGELAKPRNAILPIVAAIGGMVVPALIYFALNPSAAASAGWGIPMATDIAFAIGVMALLGSRVPKALVTFVVALAIVDDLGAVMVIALFYTETIVTSALVAVGGFAVLLALLNLGGVRNSIPYFIVAVGLWYAMYLSGVHATLAGVIGAMAVPAKPRYSPERFSAHVRGLIETFDEHNATGREIMTNIALRTQVQALENSAQNVATPLQRLEHFWHLPVAFVIIPIFALANAGVPIELGSVGGTLSHPVFLGVTLGLTLGKFIGIAGASWIALKMGWAELPENTRFTQIAGASLLAGIGFTMSIFVASLGFGAEEELLLIAKTGILGASLVAGAIGFVWLYVTETPKT